MTAHGSETRSEHQDRDPGEGARGAGGTGSIAARVITAGVGGALVVYGLGRRSVGGLLAALAGAWLVIRGLTGERPVELLRGERPTLGSTRETDTATEPAGPAETRRNVTIGRPREEVYEAWRDPETLSAVFGEFATVTERGEDRWHWEVDGPRGWTWSWDTRIVEDEPGERLRWESTGDAPVSSEGDVQFRDAPGDRGTEVTLRLRFDPPGGRVGEAVAERVNIVPQTLANKTLSRFKSLVETGEIPTLAGNPSARGAGDLL